MECPHVNNPGVVNWPLQSLLTTAKAKTSDALNVCSVCQSCESIWICTGCGVANCGRYVNAHGLKHFEATKKKHSVCMETKETSVFCYICDDYVVNDTHDERLSTLREHLRILKENESNKSNGSEKQISRSNRKRNKPSSNEDENHVNSKRSKKQMNNIVGLRNLGNTCFMSAVLQSLSNINEFCGLLKQLPSLDGSSLKSSSSSGKNHNNKRDTRLNGHGKTLGGHVITEGAIMTEELRKILIALSQGEVTKKAISPEALFHVIWKVVPRFRGYQQQDAHEFLRYMLDRLHTELLALLPGDLAFFQKNISPYSRRISNGMAHSSHSLVTSIFGGMLQSEVTCLICKASSKKHDPFLDLSIDIPSQFYQNRKSKDKNSEVKSVCHLQDCLQKFTDVEELADSERFFCGRCNRKQPSTKKFWIRRLPNVLCLHLKRFRWNIYSRTKIDTHVVFPLEALDMSNYLLSNLHDTRCSNSGSSLYDLAAVIVHHGSGAGSGHYTAFSSKDAQWYHFNDSNVIVTDRHAVEKSKAYILFYIQREFKVPSSNL